MPVGTPLPIITPIQDIMPHRHTGPAGVAPSVRGSLGVPSGKFIYFQILDVPAVKFFKPCMIQLFKDQIPENYLKFSFGGTFLLETRTGTSQDGGHFPCVGSIDFIINKGNVSNIPIRDVPPP